MDEKKIIVTLAALLALSAGGNLYNAAGETVELESAPSGLAVEVTGSVKTVLDKKISDSNAGPEIRCEKGVLSNRPVDTVYCADGGTAGFVLDKSTGDSIVAKTGDVTVLYQMGDGSLKATTLVAAVAEPKEAAAQAK